MSGFVYFIAGRSGGLSRADIHRFGLSHAFDSEPAFAASGSGPGGRSGVLVADGRRVSPRAMAFRSEGQTWRAIADSPGGGVWVGMLDAEPPTPLSLVREKQLPGHWVQLADGQQWLVPMARGWMGSADDPGWYIALPQYLDLDADGKWVRGSVQTEYRALWDASREFAEHIAVSLEGNPGSQSVDLDPTRYYAAACAALATNYVVSAAELVMLHALTEQKVQEVLLALIDWPTLEALIDKKKRSALSSTDSGCADCPQTTALRSAS